MEADGSSGHLCGYCNRAGHQEEDCRDRKSDRRFELAGGCILGAVLVPLALVGYIIGAIWSSIVAGFLYGRELWVVWAAWIKGRTTKGRP